MPSAAQQVFQGYLWDDLGSQSHEACWQLHAGTWRREYDSAKGAGLEETENRGLEGS